MSVSASSRQPLPPAPAWLLAARASSIGPLAGVMRPDLVLVHGVFLAAGADVRGRASGAGVRRAEAFTQTDPALGVRRYEWVDGHSKRLANEALRRMRGTAPTVDAVEIIELDEAALRRGLHDASVRALWHGAASCAAHGLDPERSFILMGAPRRLVEGTSRGLRVLWFGNGPVDLGEAEFVAHYTRRHGPLVAGHAQSIGLRRYRQVPGEQAELCDGLRELGLGRAVAPAVFAELVMGMPSLRPGALRAWRAATREIAADEKSHIDFGRSMLLLA